MRIAFRIYMFKRAAALQNTMLRFHVISEKHDLGLLFSHMAIGTGIQWASLTVSSCLK